MDWESQFKYLLADFENYRKRTGREHERVRDRVRAEILRALLPLYEAFDRSRESLKKLPETDAVRRGTEIVAREWSAFFDAEGVRPLAVKGRAFRPEDHEAVGEAPPSSDAPAGTIAEVVQQGYAFSGGLLRPAKVVVSREPPPKVRTPAAADSNDAEKE